MTRRAHHDPRSLLELRRLAYHAPRDSAARYVLHDALLETVPAIFEKYIEHAHHEDTHSGLEQVVWFRPKRMYHYLSKVAQQEQKRKRWNPINWFFIGTNRGHLAKTIDIERSEKRYTNEPGTVGHSMFKQGVVIVYRTRGAL